MHHMHHIEALNDERIFGQRHDGELVRLGRGRRRGRRARYRRLVRT
jgi:hypothetical protein